MRGLIVGAVVFGIFILAVFVSYHVRGVGRDPDPLFRRTLLLRGIFISLMAGITAGVMASFLSWLLQLP